MKDKTVCFSNQKGGVGKSTTCRELGICLASKGKKILLVDCDSQGNLSKGLSDEEGSGLYDALMSSQIEFTKIDETNIITAIRKIIIVFLSIFIFISILTRWISATF